MNTKQDAPVETIDSLLRIPGFAAYRGPVYRGIVDIVLDGEKLRRTGLRIGDLPLDFGVTEDRLPVSEEIVAVANVLALQGHPNVTLIKGERPDFTVNMPDGLISIEHTRAYTGYQFGSDEQLFQGIRGLRTDPDFRKKIGKITISLTLDRSPIYRTPVEALEDPEPLGFMGNRDVSKMLAEIHDLASRGYFQSLVGKGSQSVVVDDAPTLAKFRANVDVDTAISEERVGIQAVVATWKPGHLSLFEACLVSINDKIAKAAKYPMMPDWLVIQAIGPPDVFVYDLADNEMRTQGPFKKVFVLYPHVDGRLYLASYTAGTDGRIEAQIPELPPMELPYDEALHEWAATVDSALDSRRLEAWFPADAPKIFSAPMQVQWYRKWLGLNPWVLCQSKGNRVQMCFFVAGDWAGRRVEELALNDIEGATERIWNFIFSNTNLSSG